MSRIDIVDVIDSYVPLKKAGKDHTACCPFHSEKTPSFTVSQPKQFYHCFGCQANGTAIGFLMEYANMSFPEAIEELADRAGLEMPTRDTSAPAQASSKPLFDILAQAALHYAAALKTHPEAHRAVDYLKRRGLTGDVAKRFELGFAPPGWSNLSDALLASERSEKREVLLVTAGLSAERGPGNKGIYDRLRDRIVFPIHDRRGRVIGFGGRVIDEGEPKYLNSPETPVFHKGRELYGLFQARKANSQLKRLLVVEGYMDVVALFQHGITYAVATLGTAATPEHVEQLFRGASEVVFCFDGDTAGRRAAWRALENTLPAMQGGRSARFMFLPDGEDPDSMVRKLGSGEFEKLIDKAQTLTDVLFERLLEQTDRESIDGRAKLIELAKPYLERLPETYRQLVFERLAELSRMNAAELSTMVTGRTANKSPSRGKSPHSTLRARHKSTPVRQAITLLVHYPQLAASTDSTQVSDQSTIPGARLLSELIDKLIELLRTNPNLTTGGLLEHFRDHDSRRHLERLAHEEAPSWLENKEQEFKDCLARVQFMVNEARFETLEQKLKHGSLDDDERMEFVRLASGLRAVPEESREK